MAGGDAFKCELCSKSYRHEKKLKRHVQTVHVKSLKFQCLSCGRVVSSEAKLIQHSKGGKCAIKKESKKRKVYSCHECNETFFRLTSLRKHFKSDHDKKQVKPKLFSSSVYFEEDDDVEKCLHERVSQPVEQQQQEAAGVDATWR